jgi:hypothetical protein
MHQLVGVGSQYAIAAFDADGNYVDGSKTYKVTLPKHFRERFLVIRALRPANTFHAADTRHDNP